MSESRSDAPGDDLTVRPSVLYSTLEANALARAFLPKYNRGRLLETSLHKRGLNDTYAVSTDTGKLALRVYRARWRSRQQVDGEVAVLQHLAKKALPVASPLVRTDGQVVGSVEAPEGARCVVMFEWVAGKELDYKDANQARRFGELAARLHNAGDDFSVEVDRPKIDLNQLLEVPREAFSTTLGSRPDVRRYFEELSERVSSRLAAADQSRLDWGLCHGDLHGGNVLVNGDQMTMIDFDCCGIGWREFDLATYRWAVRPRNCEAEAWEPFIDAYTKVRPVSALSLSLIPLFVILRQLWLMGVHAANSSEMGVGFLTDAFFDRLVAFCQKLEPEAFGS